MLLQFCAIYYKYEVNNVQMFKEKHINVIINIGGKCFEGSSDPFILGFPMHTLVILFFLRESIYMWITKPEAETCVPQAHHILSCR